MSWGGFIGRRLADAVLPGSGVALSLLEWLKPLIPYVLGLVAVALAAFVIWRAPWAERRGEAAMVAKYQPVLLRAEKRMQRAVVVLAGANTVMTRQSASIRAQATAQNAALANAYVQIAAADKRDVSRKAQIGRLLADAAKPVSGPPCELSDEVKADWQ